MAIWGISTTTETAANNYAIPKNLSENDRENTPWNCFADNRGWVYRRYGTTEQSGLSTTYYDEVLVPVSGLNTAGSSSDTGATGLGTATPVAIFFEDPNQNSRISLGAGSTSGISTAGTVYVHVVWNESVYCGAGATIRVRTLDANNANESAAIIGYAASVAPGAQLAIYTNADGDTIVNNFNGQISNRVAFALTAPSSVLTADVNFLTTATTTGQTVAIGSTVIFVDSVSNVSAGSSLSITGKLTNAPVVSIGNTFVRIGTASTISSTITAGIAATFSTRTNATKLFIDLPRGVVGTITDFSDAAAVIKTFTSDILRQVGGAGTVTDTSVGIGTTTLTVTA